MINLSPNRLPLSSSPFYGYRTTPVCSRTSYRHTQICLSSGQNSGSGLSSPAFYENYLSRPGGLVGACAARDKRGQEKRTDEQDEERRRSGRDRR